MKGDELREKYIEYIASLLFAYPNDADRKKSVELLWEKWMQLHLSFLKEASDKVKESRDLLAHDFLNKRSKLINLGELLFNGSSREKEFYRCILEHDSFFMSIIELIYKEVRLELKNSIKRYGTIQEYARVKQARGIHS